MEEIERVRKDGFAEEKENGVRRLKREKVMGSVVVGNGKQRNDINFNRTLQCTLEFRIRLQSHLGQNLLCS